MTIQQRLKLAGGVQTAARKTYGSLTQKPGASTLLTVPGKGPQSSSPSASAGAGGDKTPSKKKSGGPAVIKKVDSGKGPATAGSVGPSPVSQANG
jgi:hypothetical protein